MLVASACRSQPVAPPRVYRQVRGTITADDQPLAKAQVCAWRRGPRVRAVREDVEPQCTQSDAAGAYVLDLEVGVWLVGASAREHQPRSETLALRASETGLSHDFSLRPGGRRFAGRLVDLDDAPIVDARVDAFAWDSRWVSTRTDANGHFELWAAEGAYLHATAPGHIGALLPRANTFVLLPESTITGRVIDAAGRPVEGARVAHRSMGPSFGFPRDATRTDAEGRFRLGGLTPGTYRLIAHNDESGGYVEDIGVDYAQSREGVEITLSQPFRPLRARVVDTDGSPLAGCAVMLGPDELEYRSRVGLSLFAWTDEEGLIDVPIANGRYLVGGLSCPDRIGAPPYEALSVGLSGEAIPRLTVSRGQALRGRLLDVNGEPLADVRVKLSYRDPERESLPLSADADANGYISMGNFMTIDPDAITDAEGRFEIPALPPGTFIVDLDGWREIWAPAGVETPTEVTITADAPTEVSLTMAASGRIELRSSRAGAGQLISIRTCSPYDDYPVRNIARSVQTDERGVAIVEHAPPGPLYAYVRERGFFAEERPCESPLSTRFTVSPGQTTQVTLPAAAQARTLVRVQSPAGEPIANAIVRLQSQSWTDDPPTSLDGWSGPESLVITDAQGLARVDPCDRPTCTVTAARPGRFATTTLAPGQGEVEIQL